MLFSSTKSPQATITQIKHFELPDKSPYLLYSLQANMNRVLVYVETNGLEQRMEISASNHHTNKTL
jgi:hypothetical protein